MMYAWHFVGATLRDGSPVPDDGVTLRHNGDLELCASGLHASRRVIDALQYAPGSTLCRVKCGGEIIEGDDKLVCSERTIVYRIDVEHLLRAFARQCALDVIHLWDAPAVVREYLTTGDGALSGDAAEAAHDAVRAAANAARFAAWAAAEAAEAAKAAAWAAARDAAEAAARFAARAAKGDRDANMNAYNAKLEKMVKEIR